MASTKTVSIENTLSPSVLDIDKTFYSKDEVDEIINKLTEQFESKYKEVVDFSNFLSQRITKKEAEDSAAFDSYKESVDRRFSNLTTEMHYISLHIRKFGNKAGVLYDGKISYFDSCNKFRIYNFVCEYGRKAKIVKETEKSIYYNLYNDNSRKCICKYIINKDTCVAFEL